MACCLVCISVHAQTEFSFHFNNENGHYHYHAEGSDPGGFAEVDGDKVVQKVLLNATQKLGWYSSLYHETSQPADYQLAVDSIWMFEQQGETLFEGQRVTMSRTMIAVRGSLHCTLTGISYPILFHRSYEDHINETYDDCHVLVERTLHQPSNHHILTQTGRDLGMHVHELLRRHRRTHKPHKIKRRREREARMLARSTRL